MLDDPDCRSGFEHARKNDRLWLREDSESLKMIIQAYVDLYLFDGNRHSLGMAAYLQQLNKDIVEK